jgi:glycosyltransferase involved in cell wall biosynthesis
VIPNAVDLESFYPVPPDEALRAELGMPPDEVVIGYVSSFVGYEGIRYLIEAVAILRSQGYRVRALLVGDGDERPALEEVARDLDVVNGVTFTGRVPHARVLDHYGLIDIFVVPRTDDRVCRLVTPLKPYEAMATARPVVVSGVGALQEMVVSGETGLVFRPEDAEDLARVVEPLLVDPQARRDLGAAAKEWVTRNRTWSHNGLLYRRLYEEMGVA